MQYSGCLQMLKDVQTLFFTSLFSAVAFGVLIGQSSQSLAPDEVPRPGTSSRLRLHSLCQNRSFRLSNALDMPSVRSRVDRFWFILTRTTNPSTRMQLMSDKIPVNRPDNCCSLCDYSFF